VPEPLAPAPNHTHRTLVVNPVTGAAMKKKNYGSSMNIILFGFWMIHKHTHTRSGHVSRRALSLSHTLTRSHTQAHPRTNTQTKTQSRELCPRAHHGGRTRETTFRFGLASRIKRKGLGVPLVVVLQWTSQSAHTCVQRMRRNRNIHVHLTIVMCMRQSCIREKHENIPTNWVPGRRNAPILRSHTLFAMMFS
jgi:hypothetical protein